MREIRVSPDRNAVALRTDNPADSWNAWGVMTSINGGHYAGTEEVKDWTVLDVPEAVAAEE